MRVKTAILGVILALFVSWASALGATTPPPRIAHPGIPVHHIALPLRHAFPAPDLGRNRLLRCAKAHTC
jgi:hypothetical protein